MVGWSSERYHSVSVGIILLSSCSVALTWIILHLQTT